MGSVLMPIEDLFLLSASIQAQIIVKGIRNKMKNEMQNETATIRLCKKETIETWM